MGSLLNFFLIKPIDIFTLGNKISPTDKVRNLGVIFDSGFTFSAQVNSIRKSCFYYIRDFARIRRHLCKSTAITLANALVSSRLDYCNSLLSSISVKDLNRLQGIQNTIVELFVDFLVFHQPIVFVEACIGFRWNNEFNLKTFYLHIKVCIQVFHLI